MKIDTKRPQTDWVMLDCGPYQQLLGFYWAARRAGWGEKELAELVEDAQSADQDHLNKTLAPYCQPGYASVHDYRGEGPPLRPDGLPDRPKTDHLVRDSNSFEEISGFQLAARRAGWTEREIALVLEEAMSKDRLHFLITMAKYCRTAAD